MLSYLKHYRSRIFLIFAVKFTATMLDLLIPMILAYILDNVRDIDLVYKYGMWMLLCLVVGLTLNITANTLATRVAANCTKRLSSDLFRATTTLGQAKVDHFTQSSLISRITIDVTNVHQFLNQMLKIGIRAPILVVAGLIVVFSIDWVLALIILVLQPVTVLITYYAYKFATPLYKTVQEHTDKMVGVLRENFLGIRVVKAFAKSNYEKERFAKVVVSTSEKEVIPAKFFAFIDRFVPFLFNCGSAVVILIGAFRVDAGIINKGVVVAFLSYFTIVVNSVYMIGRIFIGASVSFVSFKRIKEVIDSSQNTDNVEFVETQSEKITASSVTNKNSEFDANPENNSVPKESTISENATKSEDLHNKANTRSSKDSEIILDIPFIEFRNVSFSYLKITPDISNISFRLYEGQSLGIIGSTGSGKTTILKLLLGIYKPDCGEILIKGKNINQYSKKTLYHMFGTAFQKDYIFDDTVKENILLGREIDAENMLLASKIAQSYEFIDKYEDKFNHHLAGGGMNLSGGQKKRIYLTRAIATNPEILVLDDVASALDYSTEQRIREGINSKLNSRVKVMVAQRFSAVKDADLILVLSQGDVIGKGNHQFLISNCPEYKEIVDIQSGQIGG